MAGIDHQSRRSVLKIAGGSAPGVEIEAIPTLADVEIDTLVDVVSGVVLDRFQPGPVRVRGRDEPAWRCTDRT